MRVPGHVHRLRRARRRVRRRRTTQGPAHGLRADRRGAREMTTANPEDATKVSTRVSTRVATAVGDLTRVGPRDDESSGAGATSWYAAARQALDRPLTSYYLLLGASGLLLTIGLI